MPSPRDILNDCTTPAYRRVEQWLGLLVAPAGNPVYVVLDNQITCALTWGVGRTTLGYTSGDLCRLLKPPLTLLRRWEGEGYAMILAAGQFKQLLAVGVHELAHCLLTARGIYESWEFSPSPVGRRRGMAGLEDDLRGWDQAATGLPWARHGIAFVRTALHAKWRSQQMGFRFGEGLFGFACAGEHYGLSPQEKYEAVLTHEFERLAHVPLIDLPDQRAPHALEELFAADINAYLDRRQAAAATEAQR